VISITSAVVVVDSARVVSIVSEVVVEVSETVVLTAVVPVVLIFIVVEAVLVSNLVVMIVVTASGVLVSSETPNHFKPNKEPPTKPAIITAEAAIVNEGRLYHEIFLITSVFCSEVLFS